MQETTHLKGSGVINITTNSGDKYNFYYGGINEDKKGKINGGVGIIVRSELEADFKPVTERVCMITTCIDDRKHTIISAYAPTFSEKNPQIREDFYSDLDSIVESVSKRNILTIAGISMPRQGVDTAHIRRIWVDLEGES